MSQFVQFCTVHPHVPLVALVTLATAGWSAWAYLRLKAVHPILFCNYWGRTIVRPTGLQHRALISTIRLLTAKGRGPLHPDEESAKVIFAFPHTWIDASDRWWEIISRKRHAKEAVAHHRDRLLANTGE